MYITYTPIGTIHTPFKTKEGMPIQSSGANGVQGTVILNEEFAEGLADLEGFSHIYLIYHFHQSKSYTLKTKPFLDDTPHGVFATRAPQRPNAIGISIVKLVGFEGNRLTVENVDILDGTPLLDIKPYIPDFDRQENCETGWIADKTGDFRSKKSDDRFN